ncbi:MAG: cellulase family glycosylhydrolase [Chloroflexi bacterium]|nr:cellulase family glycosylhydrolase [Chloroflexota bacterium]
MQQRTRPLGATLAALVLTLVLSVPSVAQQSGGTTRPGATPTATPRSLQPIPNQVVLPLPRAGLKGIAGHWWFVERYGTRLLDEYVKLGVTNVRLAVDWLQIEPAEGMPTFDRLDPIMDAFLERGIEVVPVVATIPAWASLNPPECVQNTMTCQLNPEKLPRFQATMRQLVARYPEARRWEFWNEPEMWVSMRNPAEYERWYRAFYQAAREANPNAVIAVGTLTGWDFFRQLGPDLPVDAVTVHSYAGSTYGLDTNKIVRLHEGLRSRGLTVPVWLTEYGWDSHWMDHRTRAAMLTWVFTWALSQPFIELADYHMLHDTEAEPECCYGLVGGPPAFAPKQPAYDTFRSVAIEGWAPRPQVREPLRASARPGSSYAAVPPLLPSAARYSAGYPRPE